ncbi:MAG: N-acetylmuramoyl-L-alanine amidase [Gammaproteobacteria bacterium]|nr:N-acetylmuramoyl-L-alanine amidase [Gammaproteobacteria bacterium]
MSRHRIRLFLFLLLSIFSVTPVQAVVSVHNVREWRAPDHTRLVFDVSGPVQHRLSLLTDPNRIVLDLEDAEWQDELSELDFNGPVLAGLRTGRADAKSLRVVLDLKMAVQPRSFVLKPAGPYGHRLVLDLYDPKAQVVDDDKAIAEPEPVIESKREAKRTDKPKPIIVAIDAGHGGEDPGALGRRYRTREKDVTLAIAREVARRINQAPGMRAVLIRDGDYYVGLRERFTKARKHQADLFISIHADAVPGRAARGSSVYALSEKGATSAMAKYLADGENASDLIGGVSLNDKDEILAKVLLDLSHTKTIQDSLVFASDMLGELHRVGPLHGTRVRQAGFAVLKAPDIPSVLIETAFISNPTEEKKLRSSSFQQEMADGIYKGVKRFLARTPQGTAAIAREREDEPSPTARRRIALHE